jgi:hypothetical protein
LVSEATEEKSREFTLPTDLPALGSTQGKIILHSTVASDAFDCSFRQTPVSIFRNEIEISRDQSKLYARTATVKNKNIHRSLQSRLLAAPKCVMDDLLSLTHDLLQMGLIAKALCVDLVNVFGAGGPGGKPATLGHNFQPTYRCSVTRGIRQPRSDRFAGET